MLRAVALALCHNARGNVCDSNSAVCRVHVLSTGPYNDPSGPINACAATHRRTLASISVDLEIPAINIKPKLNVPLLWRHEHCRKGGMPLLLRIVRRYAHQAMHARLRLRVKGSISHVEN